MQAKKGDGGAGGGSEMSSLHPNKAKNTRFNALRGTFCLKFEVH